MGASGSLKIRNRLGEIARLSGVESLRPQDPSWQNYLWFSNGYRYAPGTDRDGEVNGRGSPYSGLYPDLYDAPIVRAFSHEPRRDLVAAVSNTWDGALVSAFDYSNAPAGRRTRRVDATQALPVTHVSGRSGCRWPGGTRNPSRFALP